MDALSPKAGENFIDCTVGQGGHAKLILEANGPTGKVMGIDLDPKQIENASRRLEAFGDRLILVTNSYGNVTQIVKEQFVEPVHGILMDVGFSSWQIENAGRGFSFQTDEPLDMRFNPQLQTVTAAEIINQWPEQDLADTIFTYGEERYARKIAKKIVEERRAARIITTFELARVIKEATPSNYWHGRIHYATRTFQAIRIAVNGELETLEKALPQAVELLAPGGRLAVISFHSLEDRIVKQFLKEEEKKGIIFIQTKKPIEAEEQERGENPRARSAKLRVAIKK